MYIGQAETIFSLIGLVIIHTSQWSSESFYLRGGMVSYYPKMIRYMFRIVH